MRSLAAHLPCPGSQPSPSQTPLSHSEDAEHEASTGRSAFDRRGSSSSETRGGVEMALPGAVGAGVTSGWGVPCPVEDEHPSASTLPRIHVCNRMLADLQQGRGGARDEIGSCWAERKRPI